MPGRRPTRSDEVPEADALEQATPVNDPGEILPDGVEPPPLRELPREAPEADVLEQATEADEGDGWDERAP
jgi:hypothetical protein